MSPNTNSSEKNPSTSINGEPSDNNYSIESHSNIKDQDSKNDEITKTITVTKHLCDPCPILYVDYFKSVRILCKDPSHSYDKVFQCHYCDNFNPSTDESEYRKHVVLKHPGKTSQVVLEPIQRGI